MLSLCGEHYSDGYGIRFSVSQDDLRIIRDHINRNYPELSHKHQQYFNLFKNFLDNMDVINDMDATNSKYTSPQNPPITYSANEKVWGELLPDDLNDEQELTLKDEWGSPCVKQLRMKY